MQRSLDAVDLAADPIDQFGLWFQDALNCPAITEPNAMTVSTVSPDGKPHARYVLLKGVSAEGFVFFTNYLSEKGRDLEAHPYAALTFGWIEQERQVRIEGRVSKTARSAVEAYFQSRPRGSRLGAWASEQSTVIPDRAGCPARRGGRALSRGGATAGVLGRVLCRARAGRVLARAHEPPARPTRIPQGWRRMGDRASGSLTRMLEPPLRHLPGRLR
jgi:hypothetical protein